MECRKSYDGFWWSGGMELNFEKRKLLIGVIKIFNMPVLKNVFSVAKINSKKSWFNKTGIPLF